jgi:hydroxypyruvate reductase
MPDRDPRAQAAELFREVAERIDGSRLVRESGLDRTLRAATHVLAMGKVALPMLAGARAVAGPRPTLAIAPEPAAESLQDVEVLVADHPLPSARSVAAAAAARAFLAARRGTDRVLVLLSGGASSLMCAPAPPLSLGDKRAAVAAVARSGAAIAGLNAVRKHLSAVKGGQLALETPVPVTVLALSDVVGDDPAVIGSGPFSADPSTYAEALAAAGSSELPPVARAMLEAGARGERPETPKPGDPRLGHVDVRVLAGPTRVLDEARAAATRRGLAVDTLWTDTEDLVDDLAERAFARLTAELQRSGPPRALIGNGEPSIRVPSTAGRGGRATHLALLVARALASLPDEDRTRVAFLSAGTDVRDGSAPVAGAAVDGGTCARAAEAGVDAAAAARNLDSFTALAAAGDTVSSPGTSNLLDLHILVVS